MGKTYEFNFVVENATREQAEELHDELMEVNPYRFRDSNDNQIDMIFTGFNEMAGEKASWENADEEEYMKYVRASSWIVNSIEGESDGEDEETQ